MRKLLRRAAPWIVDPFPSRWLALVPIGYMALTQVLVGIPDPHYWAGAAGEGPPRLVETVSRAVFLAPPEVRNLVHVPLFGVLTWLWCQALGSWVPSTRTAVALAALMAGAFACFSEWVQSFIPTRFASAADLAYNGLGIVAAAALYLAVRSSRTAAERAGGS